MTNKEYYLVSSSLFLVVGVLHLMRAFYGWEAVIGGVVIPVWCSWVAAVLLGYLAARGFHAVHVLHMQHPQHTKRRK